MKQLDKKSPASGFTLIELMVVLVIIGILVSIATSKYTKQLRAGELNGAKPYMMAIAAKLRITKNQYGDYIKDGYANYIGGLISDGTPTGLYPKYAEQYLEDSLGVDLNDAGDYCFVVRIGDNNYISTSGNGVADRFEVWAILRGATTTVTANGAICTVAEDKLDSSGWVDNAVLAGRVVALRYPPTDDGLDGTLDWINGFTISDALSD